MRLNRGTIILILISLVVIIGVLLLNNNQAAAPGVTPAAVTAAPIGPLFADLNQENIARLQVVDNTTGAQVVLTRGATGIWTIAEATNSADRETDQAAAAQAVNDFAALQANDTFASEALGDFGLEKPAYVASLTTTDGKIHTMYIGDTNPTGNRRYVLVQTEDSGVEVTLMPAPPEEATEEATAETTEAATAEATSEPVAEATVDGTPTATPVPYEGVTLGTSGTVFLVLDSAAGSLANLINNPPYIPAPTETPTPLPTLNPLSEVEQATLTAQFNASITAIFDQLATDDAATATAAAATAEATAEATTDSN